MAALLWGVLPVPFVHICGK